MRIVIPRRNLWRSCFGRARVSVMGGIHREVPYDPHWPAGGRHLPLEVELKRRLLAAMYGDGVIGGSASCILGNLEKEQLHQWLGACPHVAPLSQADFLLEHRNLDEWSG